MGGLYAAYGDFVLKLCLLGIAAIATGVAFVVIVREVKRYAKTLRRVGFVQSLLLGTFIYGMIREGVITQDDKEEYRDAMAPIMEERAAMARILLPSDDDDLARRNDSSKSEDGLNALTRESDENADASGPDRNLRDATQEIAESDYEAGIILAEVRTNEVHDFTAPPNAIWQQDWLNFGGFADNFRLEFEGLEFPFGTNSISALTVFQRGLMRPRTVVASSFIAPMQARLGAVPAYRHSLLPEANRPSGFWHCFTPSNSVVMTWRNFLLGQDALCPVTLQAELFEDGCAEFRYDLSQAGAETITNIVAGIRCNSLGTTLDSLDANVTTIRWQRLNPADAQTPDADGDGITTADEIFVYHTNPHLADSDYDGLSDYAEISETGTDPTNAHSQSQAFCDSVALAIGDEDPHACPPGSTNTVFEHVFYAGTTNALFAYPLSTDDAALLRISVSGSGSGEMVIGDEVVPLLAPPQMRSGPSTNTLLKSIGRGVVKRLWFRKPEGLDVSLASDDFMVGELPNPLKFYGWLAFPHTNATPACIHDLNAKGTYVALEHGEEVPGLSALWSCASHDVAVTNRPPVGAELYGSFSTRQSREVAYTLSHPDYLAGQTTFLQTLRFCPQLDDEDEASTAGFPDGVTTNMCHCVEPGGIVCGCCAYGSCNCPNPECPCYGNPSIAPDETAEEDAEDEYDATMALPAALNVLQLHGNVATQDVVHLDVPDEYRKCCSCPDHRTNHVALAYRSRRLSVTDASGADFSATNLDCNVVVRGLEPSIAPFDDAVLFSTNGASYLSGKYTVLGVRMNSPCGYDTSVYNALSPSFGVPVTVNTNLMNAARFELHTDILLSNGLVRVALENATCGAQVWLPEYTVWRFDDNDMWLENHPPVLLLDADTVPERYFTIRQWRSIMRNRGSDRTQPLMVVSPAAGHLDFVFSYATAHGDHAIKTGIRQRVTFVKPPLLPDYDGDGRIDASDLAAYLAGRIFRFWTNKETARGRYVGDALSPNILGSLNSSDDEVDGEYDLINFFPLALDLAAFPQSWKSGLSIRLASMQANSPAINACLCPLPWADAGAIYTNDVQTVGGESLCGAQLMDVDMDGRELPIAVTGGLGEGCGVVVAEARREGVFLDIEVRDSQGRTLYAFDLPSMIVDVERLYRWANLRPVCGDSSGVASSLGNPLYDLDGESDGRHFVFVHGYNVNASAARTWANQIFKRLWVSGSRSMFTAVDWCGDSSQFSTLFHGDVSPDYYMNVMNAFATASNLVDVVAALPGTNKVMLAHSLGNMLVSSAAVDHGLEYSRYYMLNAAVPMEAYTTNAVTVSQMIDDAWELVPLQYRASDWNKLFLSTTNDFRYSLSWKGRFASISNSVNCYSTSEDVLENASDNGYGEAWAQQELLKGTAVWHGINAIIPWNWNERVSCEGGWGVNTYYAADPTCYAPLVGFYASVSNLTREAVIEHPLFTPLRAETDAMHSTNLFTIADSDYSAMLRAKFLGDAIPATSFAAGANCLEGWGDSRNVNFSGCIAGDWPRSNNEWRHSDIKNIAYRYLYKLFFDIVKGEPR